MEGLNRQEMMQIIEGKLRDLNLDNLFNMFIEEHNPLRGAHKEQIGKDENAVHIDEKEEIDGIMEKASPVNTDLVLIEDSANGKAKKKVQLGNLPSVSGVNTSGIPVANDIARFTDADTIEGRSYAELKADLNLEIGTDVLAEKTIGIANDNLVEMDDADAADDDFAKFTANGLEGRSYSEVRGDINVADGADVTGSNTPQAHKNLHDPEDGADPLDAAAPPELAGVQAADEGSAHSFARSDHDHQIQHSIADNHLVTVDGTPADDDYAKFTANGLEGRSYAEVFSDLSGVLKYIAPGTDTLSTAVAAMSNGDILILGNGTYTQTVEVSIPNSVTHFGIIGKGVGSTLINFTSDVDGITSDDSDDAYRIVQAVLSGFRMTMSAVSSAKTAIYLYGDSVNYVVNPSIVFRDISTERTDSNKYWGIGFKVCNGWNVVFDNCYARAYPYLGTGIELESCVNAHIRGGYYHELNIGINLIKADDAKIEGASTNGCEGVTIAETSIVKTNFAVVLGEKCLNTQIVNPTFDFLVVRCVYELDTATGYHTIQGGWMALANSATGAEVVTIEEPGTTIQGVVMTGLGAGNVTNGIVCRGANCTIGGNNIRYSGVGIWLQATADNCTVVGNTVPNGRGAADILLDSGAQYNAVLANTVDVAVTDNGSNNEVAHNPVY